MAGIITNIVQNSLAGFVSGAVSTAGGYAGSAVNGIGNLIEGAGESLGNGGIAKSFEGVGNGITSYGTSVMNATAPNAGSGGMKRIDPASKPKPAGSKAGVQKTLPSSSGAEKALPSTKPMKALPAPSSAKSTSPASKKELPKAKPGYKPFEPTEKSGYKPFEPTPPGGSYRPPASVAGAAPAADRTKGLYQAPKRAASVAGDTGKQGPDAIKSRTISSGKVVASRASLPQPKAAAPSSAKASSSRPRAAAGPSGEWKTPSKAGSVVGGPAEKNFSGHLPGFDVGKAPSRAPTVVGVGNKAGAKPPPSKAGSIVAGGGPKFF